MKPLFLVFIVAIIASCAKENPQIVCTSRKKSIEEPISGQKVMYGGVKPKIKFKHHGLDPQGNRNPGCDSPLGLCIIFGIRSVSGNYEFTREERNDQIGSAEFIFYPGDTLMEMVPDMPFAFPDNSTLIEDDMLVESEISEQYGYRKILIKKGRYVVNPAIGPHGSALLKIEAIRL